MFRSKLLNSQRSIANSVVVTVSSGDIRLCARRYLSAKQHPSRPGVNVNQTSRYLRLAPLSLDAAREHRRQYHLLTSKSKSSPAAATSSISASNDENNTIDAGPHVDINSASTTRIDEQQSLQERRQLLFHSLQNIMTTFPKSTLAVNQSYTEHAKRSKVAISDARAEISALPLVNNISTTEPVDVTDSVGEKILGTNDTLADSSTTPSKPTTTTTATKSKTEMAVEKQKQKQTTSQKNQLVGKKIWKAIRAHNIDETIRLYNAAVENNEILSIRILSAICHLLVNSKQLLTYSILRKMRQSENELTDNEFKIYLRLCEAVGNIEPLFSERRKVRSFVSDLMKDLAAMDHGRKKDLLPKLIIGLLTQKNVVLGTKAHSIYEYMINNDIEMRPGWLKKVLALSQYNRQDDLPFHDVMRRLIESDSKPHPINVIKAVHNMFPFTDPESVCVALRALIQFQANTDLQDFPFDTQTEEISIDLDCLELISSGAAQTGSAEMMFLVWEILEQSNFTPTQAIYENSVVAFATGGEKMHVVFGAIKSMKEDGFEVPRSLMRSVSYVLRPKKAVLDHGMMILASSPDLQSLETFNVMLSCYAERGNVHDIHDILDTMSLNDILPDANTYSFAMECLGKNLHRYSRFIEKDSTRRQIALDHADMIISSMEENGVSPSRDLFRNYMELLCIADDLATANTVMDDILVKSPQTVCSKALYRLALTNAEKNDFKRAYELSALISDDIPTLNKKIRSLKARAQRTTNKNILKPEGF